MNDLLQTILVISWPVSGILAWIITMHEAPTFEVFGWKLFSVDTFMLFVLMFFGWISLVIMGAVVVGIFISENLSKLKLPRIPDFDEIYVIKPKHLRKKKENLI